MENLAQTAQTGTSGTAQAAIQAPSRFDAFISKLHAWKQLPVVHTSKVHTSGAVLTVLIRTAQNDLLLPSSIFLMTGAAYAGPVNRVVFSDQTTGESAEVDVMLCSTCIVCGMMNSTTLSPQPRVPLPIVHNSDQRTTTRCTCTSRVESGFSSRLWSRRGSLEGGFDETGLLDQAIEEKPFIESDKTARETSFPEYQTGRISTEIVSRVHADSVTYAMLNKGRLQDIFTPWCERETRQALKQSSILIIGVQLQLDNLSHLKCH
jgi:hypothetical protein